MSEQQDISAWMREQRLSRNLTQAELAGILEVSTAAVASWESGARKMKPKTLAKFKAVLAGNDPLRSSGALQQAVNTEALKLTIREAKEALARNYDVSPEAIDITIRG